VASKQNILPVAGILSGALVWGLIWYPYRAIQEAGMSAPLATLVSYTLAILCGVFMLPRGWWKFPQNGWWLVGLALTAGWANFGYVLAMLNGEVMRVLLLFYLAPVWTILFSYWLLNEKLNRYGYLVISLSLGGAFIMLWEPHLGVPLPKNISEWLGLSAGMGFALSNVFSLRAKHLSLEVKSFGVWFGTTILTTPLIYWQGKVFDQLFAIHAQTWVLLTLLGIVLCATSYAIQYSISRLPANRAIILFLFELVFAALASYILADEVMQLRDWLGAVLIISASIFSGRIYSTPKN